MPRGGGRVLEPLSKAGSAAEGCSVDGVPLKVSTEFGNKVPCPAWGPVRTMQGGDMALCQNGGE